MSRASCYTKTMRGESLHSRRLGGNGMMMDAKSSSRSLGSIALSRLGCGVAGTRRR